MKKRPGLAHFEMLLFEKAPFLSQAKMSFSAWQSDQFNQICAYFHQFGEILKVFGYFLKVDFVFGQISYPLVQSFFAFGQVFIDEYIWPKFEHVT